MGRPNKDSDKFLAYFEQGANGSVGSLAVQLAKLSGYSVIAVTSSSRTTNRARAYGADHVYSDDEPELVSRICRAHPDIGYAFDAVVSTGTTQKAMQCLSSSSPRKITTAIAYPGELLESVDYSSVYSGILRGTDMKGNPSQRGKEIGAWLWRNLNQWLESKQIAPLEFEVMQGLGHIPDGLKSMQDGAAKVKLVAML